MKEAGQTQAGEGERLFLAGGYFWPASLNAMSAAAENIQVVARFRPTSAREAAAQSADVVRFGDDGRCVTVGAEDGSGNSFVFDGVLRPSATQADTYGHVSAIVEAVLQGYNGTILAYGQTGSGKTHSVMGSRADPGLLPRAVQHAFRQLGDDSNGARSGRVWSDGLAVKKRFLSAMRCLRPLHGASAAQFPGPFGRSLPLLPLAPAVSLLATERSAIAQRVCAPSALQCLRAAWLVTPLGTLGADCSCLPRSEFSGSSVHAGPLFSALACQTSS
jgi:kinesin family protein 5